MGQETPNLRIGPSRDGEPWYSPPTTRKWKPDSVNCQTDHRAVGGKDYVWPQREGEGDVCRTSQLSDSMVDISAC